MRSGVGIIVGFVILFKLQPINEHLKKPSDKNAFRHLIHTISTPRSLQGFAATALLGTGGWMLMPFSSAFSVNNLGISMEQLSMVYMITGLSSMIIGPFIGKIADSVGKFPVFCFGTIVTAIAITIYCRLGITPLHQVILINVILFVGISARIIAAGAINSAVPSMPDRGAYMAISASVQQLSGGMASALAGLIVAQEPSGKILHFDRLGFVVIGSAAATLIMMYFINQYVQKKTASEALASPAVHLSEG